MNIEQKIRTLVNEGGHPLADAIAALIDTGELHDPDAITAWHRLEYSDLDSHTQCMEYSKVYEVYCWLSVDHRDDRSAHGFKHYRW
jgi:hypothetical protein